MPIAYHTMWNFFEGSFYGFLVSGTDDGNTVFSLSSQGNTLVSGGKFGPEGGLVVTAVLILTFLFLYFFVKTPKEIDSWHIIDN